MQQVHPMFARAALAGPMLAAAGLAAGGLPTALNHVPADAEMYVAIPSVGGMLRDVSAFYQAMAGKLPPDAAQIGMGLFLAQSIATQPGVETDGSAAVIVTPPTPEQIEAGADPEVTVILPIADLEAFAAGPFMAGQNAKIVDGVLTAAMPEGDTVYIRDIGSHAVLANDLEKVKAFQSGNAMAAHESALGLSGVAGMEGRDMVFVANIPALKGVLDQMMLQAEQQVNFLAMMGGGEQVTQGFAAFKQAITTLQQDGSVWLTSIDIAGDGVALDFGASFRDETPSAQMFQAAGDSGALMGVLPATDFLVAYAFDASSESVRGVMNKIMEMVPAQGNDGDFGMRGMMAQSSGFSGVIGSSPAALGGAGLLARQISYARTDDAPKAIKAMRGMIEGMNGQAALGMTYDTTYTPAAAEVAGVKVDSYAVKSKMDPTAAPGGMMMMDPSMIQNLMYGMAGGPTGYIAQGNGGVYTTSSMNSELLASALDAGKDGASLAANERLRGVASRLQPNRMMEAYLSADQVFNAVAPMAQMLGMIDEFEPIEPLSPMGMSLRGDQGGLMGRVYLPGDLIGFALEFAQKMEAADQGFEEDAPTDPDF
jgi:hypothetical protein